MLIETLKSKIGAQQDFLASSLSVEAKQYYEDDWGCYQVESRTVACPVYYHAYYDGIDEEKIARFPPDNKDDLNLGYLYVPENTIETLASKQALFKEHLLFVDRLLRLEDYMRINNSEDEGLAKKIDRGLEIISKVITLFSSMKRADLSELVKRKNNLIQHTFLIEHVNSAINNMNS